MRWELYCFCEHFLQERLQDLHEHSPVDEARVHLSSPIDNRTMRWHRPRVIIRIPLLQPKPKKKVDLQNMIIHSIDAELLQLLLIIYIKTSLINLKIWGKIEISHQTTCI